MPLTKTGSKVMSSMQSQYGEDKGERVFYASINAKKPGSSSWHRKTRKTSLAHRTLMAGGR